jgi:hypothetical protein
MTMCAVAQRLHHLHAVCIVRVTFHAKFTA